MITSLSSLSVYTYTECFFLCSVNRGVLDFFKFVVKNDQNISRYEGKLTILKCP